MLLLYSSRFGTWLAPTAPLTFVRLGDKTTSLPLAYPGAVFSAVLP